LTRSLAVESSTGVIGQLLRTVDAASRRTRGDRRQAARYSDVDAPRQSGSCQASLDAYNWRDVDAWFAELATPDFEWWPALTRAYEGGCYQGREGVERFVADTRENWEELQTIAEEFRDLGDWDRIWRYRVYLDRAEGLRAGVSE